MAVPLRTRQPRRPEEIEPVTYPDRLVLIDPVTGRLAQLDAVAALVWLYADGQRTGSDIAAEIAKATEFVTEAKVEEVIGILAENRFLELDG